VRVLIRVALVLLALVVIGVGALALFLPRIVASDAFRERVRAAARDATGGELSWGELSFGLLPPRLVVMDAKVTEGAEAEHPLVEARRVDLQVALAPLLARTVVIDSLVLDGVTLRLVRTARGIELPLGAPQAARAGGEAAAPASPEQGGGAAGLSFAARRLELVHARVILEDRAVKPPTTWELQDVEASARGTSLAAPLAVELHAALASGGKLSGSGTITLGGPIDLTLDLDGVALMPLVPYLGEGVRIRGGTVSGRVRASGRSAEPEAMQAKLVLEGADLALDEIALQGALAVEVNLTGGLEKPTGTFEIDATNAKLIYGEAFAKPPGTQATATGRIVPGAGGTVGVDDVRLRVKNLDAQARRLPGRTGAWELSAPPFDVGGWDALLPALADARPSGRVAFDKLVVSTDPFALRGRIPLDAVVVHPTDGPEVVFTGALVGAGGGIGSQGLVARVGGQPIQLGIELSGLDANPLYRADARLEGADSNALLTALGTAPDTLYGPLNGQAKLAGPIGDAAPVSRTIRGEAGFQVDHGRLRGVSLLRGAMDGLGGAGEAALLLGRLRGGKTLQRFYEDEFETLRGNFQIAQGVARTQDLQIVYQHYQVDLRGTLGLADESLDFTGTLTINPEVDAAIAEAQGAAAAGQPKVIPLAAVTGTLSEPRVRLTREAALALASTAVRGRTHLEQKLDERLGPGAGKQVFDTLEGLLGPRKQESQ
jgi:AsmA protein